MFKYRFGVKTTLLESLRSQKSSYNDLGFAGNEFLRLVGAPNESLILIIIYYMFKYSVGIKKHFARVTSEPKNPFTGTI